MFERFTVADSTLAIMLDIDVMFFSNAILNFDSKSLSRKFNYVTVKGPIRETRNRRKISKVYPCASSPVVLLRSISYTLAPHLTQECNGYRSAGGHTQEKCILLHDDGLCLADPLLLTVHFTGIARLSPAEVTTRGKRPVWMPDKEGQCSHVVSISHLSGLTRRVTV